MDELYFNLSSYNRHSGLMRTFCNTARVIPGSFRIGHLILIFLLRILYTFIDRILSSIVDVG